MENKHVGLLVIGIGFIMAGVVWLFNSLLKENINLTCEHGPSCAMHTNLSVQTWISFAIVLIVLIVGVVIMFTKPDEKIIIKTKKIKPKKKKIDKSKLGKREKKAVEILEKENGAIFQRALMEKLEIGKVGMTRLLDKLEAKQLVERKRRGMQNIVVLKR
ncbi:hypothetical protein GF378_00500 [Candidatus Pacearchaeota archaeon]|nr:hypothetical protein [Candidatus Pacearchaeota archaeon]